MVDYNGVFVRKYFYFRLELNMKVILLKNLDNKNDTIKKNK